MMQSAAALCIAIAALLSVSAHGRPLLADDGERLHYRLQVRLIAGATWRRASLSD